MKSAVVFILDGKRGTRAVHRILKHRTRSRQHGALSVGPKRDTPKSGDLFPMICRRCTNTNTVKTHLVLIKHD